MQLYSTDYILYKGFSHFNYYLIGYLLVVNTHRNLIFSLFFVMCLILWISVQITSPRILHEQVTVCGIAHLYGVCSGLVYGLLKIKKGAEAPFKKKQSILIKTSNTVQNKTKCFTLHRPDFAQTILRNLTIDNFTSICLNESAYFRVFNFLK